MKKLHHLFLKGLKQKIKIFNCKNSNLKRAEELLIKLINTIFLLIDIK